jgi:hypothetical protein
MDLALLQVLHESRLPSNSKAVTSAELPSNKRARSRPREAALVSRAPE